MTKEEKKTLRYTGTNIIIYCLKERSRINAENSRRRDRSVGKKSKEVFWEEPKEQRKETRSYMDIFQKFLHHIWNDIKQTVFLEHSSGHEIAASYHSETKINIQNAQSWPSTGTFIDWDWIDLKKIKYLWMRDSLLSIKLLRYSLVFI